MDAAQDALITALAGREAWSGKPSTMIAEASVALGRAVDLPSGELDRIRTASLLHDLGKLAIPDDILARPGDLAISEWRVVTEHPKIGQVVLEQAGALRDAATIVLHHHEWYDGRGYPHGLTGGDIPIGARIVSIVDAYEAMVSGRPYRAAISHEAALDELRRQAGVQFDPDLVEVFVALFSTGLPWDLDGHVVSGDDGARRPRPGRRRRPRSARPAARAARPGAPAPPRPADAADAHDRGDPRLRPRSAAPRGLIRSPRGRRDVPAAAPPVGHDGRVDGVRSIRDVVLLFATRSLRMFGYGFLAVVLVLYLEALGFDGAAVGLLLGLTLLGDAAISLLLTTRADRFGRRRTLFLGSLLMVGAGVVFAGSEAFPVLVVAATLGVLSPSGNEVGPFLAIEQASLAQLVDARRRTSLFARYQVAGSDRDRLRVAGGGCR